MAKRSLSIGFAPKVADGTITMRYAVNGPKESVETVELCGNIAPNTVLLPAHKRDAVAFATIVDACQQIVRQATSDNQAAWRAAKAKYRAAISAAVDSRDKAALLLLMRAPIGPKPDMPADVAKSIAPYVAFIAFASTAWQAARKHTLAVYGPRKADGIVWTGTLSSLVGRKPAKGRIAFGCRIG